MPNFNSNYIKSCLIFFSLFCFHLCRCTTPTITEFEHQECKPNFTKACFCPSGRSIQRCTSDGRKWTPCSCRSSSHTNQADSKYEADGGNFFPENKNTLDNKDHLPTIPGACQTGCTWDGDCKESVCGSNKICVRGSCYRGIAETFRKPEPVDILIVVANSKGMMLPQRSLATSIKYFVENMVRDGMEDLQIGVISTDMSDSKNKGRLLGNQKIINVTAMGVKASINALQKNILIGETGSPFHQPFAAFHFALSSKMLGKGKPNEGFLRPNATLAILIVSNKDDCSHNGKISESDVPSEVCHSPNNIVLKRTDGKPIVNDKNEPVRGQMENLEPISGYINFLKGLKRNIIVKGIIGDVIDKVKPIQSCEQNSHCENGPIKYFCGFKNPKQSECGGCFRIKDDTNSDPYQARAGYRIYELAHSFRNQHFSWTSICSLNFADLTDFGGHIQTISPVYKLKGVPAGADAILIDVLHKDGSPGYRIHRAKTNWDSCNQKSLAPCNGRSLCGPNGLCHNNGFIYYPPTKESPKAYIRINDTLSLRHIRKQAFLRVIYVQ